MRFERRFTKDGQAAYANMNLTRDKWIATRTAPLCSAPKILKCQRSSRKWRQMLAQNISQSRCASGAEAGRRKRRTVSYGAVKQTQKHWQNCRKTSVQRETSAKQVFDRLAGTWTYWGWKGGYFTNEVTPKPILTKCATCWLRRWRRKLTSGLTPACIGPMTLMGQVKDIFMLITRAAN